MAGASKIVLRDWNTGKFSRYTMPPISRENGQPLLSEADEKILSHVRTRKDIRRESGGLVKLSASEMERREVELSQPWREEGGRDHDDIPNGKMNIEEDVDVDEEDESDNEDNGSEEEEEEEETSGDEEDESQDGDDAESQADDDKELRLEPPPTKRKRAVSFVSTQPIAKKVAFVSQKQNKPSPPMKPSQGNTDTKSILKKTTSLSKGKLLRPDRQEEKIKVSGRVANTSNRLKRNKTGPTDSSAYDFSKFF